MARFGLDYEAVKRINPRVVYCSITGYGQEGPRALEAGHDINYQAVTGLLSLSPQMPAALVADVAGGAMPAFTNILLALRQRDRTGEGCHLDIAMADAMFTFAWFGLAEGHATGRFPGAADNLLAGGSPRYGLYPTADGKFLAVGALEQKFWDTSSTPSASPRHPRGIRAATASRAMRSRTRSGRTSDEWRAIMGPLDCCCTIVASLEEARHDPHFCARGLFASEAKQADGTHTPLAHVPILPAFRRDPTHARLVAEVGEHTRDLMAKD